MSVNFALILFCLLLVSGAIWVGDALVLSKRRAPDAKDPWWVEYGASFFPVILLVFGLRSFLVEPFKIPSGSMIPTLEVGDFILVNKFAYGIRLPVLNEKIINVGEPQRGDVMVFRYPEDPSLDYIKRVVGVPGDKVTYQNKRLSINGEEMHTVPDGQFNYVETGLSFVTSDRFTETLGTHKHSILIQPEIPVVRQGDVRQFPYRE